MGKKKPTIIFDFDGVIHSYKSGWKGATIIPDPPVEGIKEAILDLRNDYTVVVVSTRCYQDGGIEAIRTWLVEYGIEVDDVTNEKPPALVQIDDRALTFDGNPNVLREKIEKFVPWNKKKRASNANRVVCPKCGGELIIRSGPYGIFIGCSRYPECKFTARNLESLN